MKPLSFANSTAPTPFGWVVTAHSHFDLMTMVNFRTQLLSLSRATGTPPQETPAPAGVEVAAAVAA